MRILYAELVERGNLFYICIL